MYRLEQKNKFSVGEEIEVVRPGSEAIKVKVLQITDEEGNDMESCPHPSRSFTWTSALSCIRMIFSEERNRSRPDRISFFDDMPCTLDFYMLFLSFLKRDRHFMSLMFI